MGQQTNLGGTDLSTQINPLNWFANTPMPQVGGPNPYQGDWNSLIQQLRLQSQGGGPSPAQDAYKQAFGQGENQFEGMSRSGNPADAYNATRGMGQMNQGLMNGLVQARTGEELGATNALIGALGGASNAWMQPQQMSLQAWATQNGLDISKLQALGQMGGSLASLAG